MDENEKRYSLESGYITRKRLASYSDQLAAVLDLRPESVLEVGKGPGLVSGALRAVGVKVTTLDLRDELKPDLIGSVLEIPSEAQIFDACLCCQVLEHLPFHDFPRALRELHRVTRRALILSLPDISRHYFIRMRLPSPLKDLSWSCSISRKPRRDKPRTKGHHWEIGFPETSLSEVSAAIRAAGWNVERTWRVQENVWHRFFLLNRSADSSKIG